MPPSLTTNRHEAHEWPIVMRAVVSGAFAMSITGADLANAIDQLSQARLRRHDPYRPYIQFLVGLVGFSVVTIAAALATLPQKTAPMAPALAGMVGGVIAWMALTALVASAMALIIQAMKSWHIYRVGQGVAREPWLWLSVLLCVVAILPGAMAVMYCVRGGVALLTGAPALPTFFEAIWLI